MLIVGSPLGQPIVSSPLETHERGLWFIGEQVIYASMPVEVAVKLIEVAQAFNRFVHTLVSLLLDGRQHAAELDEGARQLAAMNPARA